MTPLTTVAPSHQAYAASEPEGCHSSSIAQLIMSDLQTSMGDDILQMIVCLRDGKEAVEQLKAIYPDEARNVEVDITAKLGELALQHRGTGSSSSAQHDRNRVLSLSLLQVRTLPSRVMTSNRARHERIQLPTI